VYGAGAVVQAGVVDQVDGVTYGMTGATGVEVGVSHPEVEWVMVHGQLVMVKVVADLTV
jgi:hypothetical protein